MPKDTESTTKFKADISQLKAAMQEAGRAISAANAEFKKATAGMDNWSKSATGLSAKIDQLDKVWKAQTSQLKSLEKQYELVVKEEGETSAGAQELAIKIENQKAAIAKTVSQGEKYAQTWKNIQSEQNSSKTAMGQLNSEISKQESKLLDLKNKYKNVVLSQGENSREAKALAKEITSLSGELDENKQKMVDADKAANDLTKGFTDVGDSAEEAGKDAEQAGNGGFTVLKGVMANLATQAINAVFDSLKKLGSTLIDLGKQAVTAYGQFEQLEGGVKKLFGDGGQSVEEYAKSVGKSVDDVKDEYKRLQTAQEQVMRNARYAYETAGMSANQYMETVTSFSAKLVSDMGGNTVEAAHVADVAIRDMSDNANTFGTDIQSIQNAYQGFAKNNYTMLDNLKLGYGGTAGEMARLINESGVLGDSVEVTAKTVKDVPFDQVIMAINTTQKRLGIFETTAREAANTLEGSANSMKAAWQNLITGIGSENANLDELINNFIDTLITYMGNLTPIVQRVVGGISTLITSFATELLPKLLETVGAELPTLIESITGLITQLVSTLLPQLLNIISEELPTFLKMGAELMVTIIKGIVSAIPSLTSAILEAISSILYVLSYSVDDIVEAISAAIPEVISAILDAVPDLVDGFTELVMEIAHALPTIFQAISEKLPELITKLTEAFQYMQPEMWRISALFFQTIVDALPQIIPIISEQLPMLIDTVVNTLLENMPAVLDAAVKMFNALIEAIPIVLDALLPALPKIIDSISKLLEKSLPQILKAATTMLMALVKAIPVVIKKLVPAIPKIIESIVNVLTTNLPVILDAAVQLLMAIVNAIPIIVEALVPEIPTIVDQIVTVLIQNIPVLLDAAIQFLMAIIDALPVIIDTLVPLIPDIVNTIVDVLLDNFPVLLGAAITLFMALVKAIPKICLELAKALPQIITTIIQALVEPIIHLFEGLWELICNIFSPIADFFGGVFGDAWEAVEDAFSSVGSFFAGIWDTITGVFTDAWRWFYRKFLNIVHYIKLPFEIIGGFFSTVWSAIKKPFEAVGKWFKDVFQEAYDNIVGIFKDIGDWFDGILEKVGLKSTGLKLDKKLKDELRKQGYTDAQINAMLKNQMASGGVLNKGQIGFLEGNGAEAVVPLDQNKKWISAVVRQLRSSMGSQGLISADGVSSGKVINFYQTNNSPKALDALEVYRETNSLLFSAGVKLNNV